MTARSSDLPRPGAEPARLRRYGTRPRTADNRVWSTAASLSDDVRLFDFDRCLEAYAQGADVSRVIDLSRYLAITDELYTTIPVAVAAVNHQPYVDVYDMKELVERSGVLYISTLHGPPYWSYEATIKTRAIHDWYTHVVPGNNFSWEGEVLAYKASLPLFPEDLHWLVYSEVILQVTQLLVHGDVKQKIVYCRSGEPLRTYHAWCKFSGRTEDTSSREAYARYVHDFLGPDAVRFFVPALIGSQLQAQ